MKGFIARTLTAACLVGALAATGCQTVREEGMSSLYDRCWPQRYNYTARRAVIDGFAPQVQNGHVLDQTIWNYHFDANSDKLTPGGMQKLDYIARRRPNPDPNLFLATAHDVAYDPADPDKFAETRRDLDLRRVASVQRYLQAQMAGRPMAFDVQIHDPYPVGQSGVAAANQARSYQTGTIIGGATTGGGTATTGGTSGTIGQTGTTAGVTGTSQTGTSTGTSTGASGTTTPSR